MLSNQEDNTRKPLLGIIGLLELIVFFLCSLVGVAAIFLLFAPSSFVDMRVPSDFGYDYYRQQSKVDLNFDEFDKATKIEIGLPLDVSDKDRAIIEDQEKIKLTKQFIKDHPDGWAKWQDPKGISWGKKFSLKFYDSQGQFLGLYEVGPNSLIYEKTYWRYTEDQEIMALFEQLNLEDEYLKLKRILKWDETFPKTKEP